MLLAIIFLNKLYLLSSLYKRPCRKVNKIITLLKVDKTYTRRPLIVII